MAGGGIASSIQTLKQNRALLKKRKIRNKGDVYGQQPSTKLKLKESTDQDMKIIRKKIKEYKRQEWKIMFYASLGALIMLYFLYWWVVT